MTSVSVIIPARNDAAALGDAVASIEAQRQAEIDEIVIAVGPSTDKTEAEAERIAAENPAIVIVANPAGRTPAGLNAAIERATGDIVVRVDARSQLPENYVAHALETMRDTGAGNVGAIQRPVGSTTRERAIAAAMRSRLGSGGAAYRDANERQQVATAYLGVFRRQALIDVGGYDEAFVRNQDAELNIRLNKAGHQVWLDPRLVVEYTPRAKLTKLASQYWQYGWWRQRTIRKHRSSVQLRQVAAPVLVLGLVGCLIFAAVVSPWFLVFPALYVVAMLAAAVAGNGPFVERILTGAALVTIHLSWGAGFVASFLSGRGAPS